MSLPLALLSFFLSLIIPTFAIPLADVSDAIPQENSPWLLTQITVFNPLPNATDSAFIQFALQDTNAQLQLNTTCQYYAPTRVPTPVTSGDGYVSCANQAVGFKYNGTSIFIERMYSYPDPS
jgi:hypothetical protein